MVSTWAKFDGHIYHGYPVMPKYLPFIMYCEVCCCLHVKTFEHMSAHWAIKVYVFAKFHIHCIYWGVGDIERNKDNTV